MCGDSARVVPPSVARWRGKGDHMPDSDAMPVVDVTDLRKRYGRVEALSGLTMTVNPGELFGFLGPNGAGKTTTVKLLLGLARPSGGGGRVLGAPLGDREARRRIGYLPELFRYQPWLRATEVLRLHADLMGLPAAGRRKAFDDVLGLVGLSDRASHSVGGFSKGMQQRLGLGVALVGDPALVILDEPTSALDPIGRMDVRAILRHARDRGAAVFLNSHLLTEVEQVCDRIAIVDRGRVVAEGSLDSVLGESATRIRVDGLAPAGLAELVRFGEPRFDGQELVFPGLPDERIPDVVVALVGMGVRVRAVASGRESLEERFLELVGRSRAGAVA
ncbi:MAG: ABC transporter ATP-binding protein [Chloroflexi bacterium]|nr:ABC transporter ATP-binding protein [Chloroflexota bacterium]